MSMENFFMLTTLQYSGYHFKMINNDKKGRISVDAVASILRNHGLNPKIMPTCGVKSPYDIFVNGLRIEVKSSSSLDSISKTWGFNIHRHGILDETHVDYYVFRLEFPNNDQPFLHLVMPSPVKRKGVRISLKSLYSKHRNYINRFDLLGGKAGDIPLPPIGISEPCTKCGGVEVDGGNHKKCLTCGACKLTFKELEFYKIINDSSSVYTQIGLSRKLGVSRQRIHQLVTSIRNKGYSIVIC